MNVPLLDLVAQYETIRDDVQAAMRGVCETQRFILGETVERFERDVADYCGVRHAIGVSSGTDALLAALMVACVGPGAEVILPPFTFFATAGTVSRLGARPVFADIRADSFNIDPARVEQAMTPRTRAIMPVDLFGQPAEMEAIREIAARHQVMVIEDAAQAIGAEYRGRRAGAIGDIGCFSFFPSKNLGGIGDGGMVTTDDPGLFERMRILRVHGMEPKYYHKWVGGNFRLDAINAAALRVKLRHLDAWTEGRRRNAELYGRLFAVSGLAGSELTLPAVKQNRHIFNQYVVRARDRDELIEALRARNIGVEVYYPVPLHEQECFADLGYRPADLPVSSTAARQTLALPIYPELTEAQIKYVADAVAGFYGK